MTSGVQPSIADWRGLGDLICLATERLTDPVEGIHRSMTRQWLRVIGHGDLPAERLRASGLIYDAIRLAGSVARTSMDVGATTIGRHRTVPPLWNSSPGAEIQAAVNALWGDEFERRNSPMHTVCSIRASTGDPIATDLASLAEAFPSPTPRLGVLLHGLGKTERCWTAEVGAGEEAPDLPTSLATDGYTPVLVRYNTGQSVSDIGSALASLLAEISSNWPVAVDEVALIGHSMGGLVARSALAAGRDANHRWTTVTRNLVALGTPHFGSPLEKGADIATRLLDKDAATRPLGQFMDGRSAGIKDMRHGAVYTDGVQGPHADPESSVAGVRNRRAASVITSSASNPIGFLVGDMVVRVASATGVEHGTHIDPGDVAVFTGLNHLAMLHDPRVLSQVQRWLSPMPDRLEQADPREGSHRSNC